MRPHSHWPWGECQRLRLGTRTRSQRRSLIQTPHDPDGMPLVRRRDEEVGRLEEPAHKPARGVSLLLTPLLGCVFRSPRSSSGNRFLIERQRTLLIYQRLPFSACRGGVFSESASIWRKYC